MPSPLLIRNPQLIARDTVEERSPPQQGWKEGREEQREGGNKKDGEEGKKSTEDGSGTQRERWHVCTFLSKNARTSSPRELTFREGGCRNRKVVLGWSLGSKLRNGTPVLAQLCHQLFQFRLVII